MTTATVAPADASVGNGPLDALFGGRTRNPVEQIHMLDALKTAAAESLREADAGETSWSRSGDIHTRTLRKGLAANPRRSLERLDTLTKSLGGDDNAAIAADIAAFRADFVETIQKDWTPSNPVGGTGLTPYDLEEQAKILVPFTTPLRNSTPREKGQGNARKFKRIDSFSNAGIPGGAAQLLPVYNSLTGTSTWGPTGNITLARPPKISYTGSDWTYSYIEMGLSDSVDWISYFEGLGFDDLRALSHTALLFSTLMGEERLDLYGRGATGGGYAGTVAAPTSTTTGHASGGTMPDNTYYVYVTSATGTGESLPSTVTNSGALAGGGINSITVNVTVESAGGLFYNLYVGTTTGIANAKFQGSFSGNSFLLTTYNASGAVAGNTDTSFLTGSYDGYLTVAANPTLSGYFARNNAALSSNSPGSEFDNAFATMYVNNGADPDEIWMTGAIRNELNQVMRKGSTNGAQSGYRTNLVSGNGDVTMGTMVTGIVNGNTGKIVNTLTHRFMPVGCALLRSTSLPLENARVSTPSSKVCVQEYMAVDWPDIQMTYDTSTYAILTLIHRAPAWHGAIVGIQ